jgi:glycosyltransferase involved in cell wall biosynthesis
MEHSVCNKVAVVSEALPPLGAGQGVFIYRMFEDIAPVRYCLLSTLSYEAGPAPSDYVKRLPANYYHLYQGRRLRRGTRFGLRRLRDHLNFWLSIADRARQITRIIRREGCDEVLAFTGDATHLPAAFLASWYTGSRFVAYVVDHYAYREWEFPVPAFWAPLLEGFLMKGAQRVIVLNEALRDDLHQRFGVDAGVIYNAFELSSYESPPKISPSIGKLISIVFTGNVYAAHYDAVRNLLAAITALNRNDINLHLYTPQPEWELKLNGIEGPVIRHDPLTLAEMPRVQMEADILFLPLAFESPYPGVIRTSAPVKMGEYLAARKPVLVHAPHDAFISRYFRQHDCGVVIDENDSELLAEGIRRILDDHNLRERVVTNAWGRAQVDFDIRKARVAFKQMLNLDQ